MPELSDLVSTILDTLTCGFISWLKDKSKTTPLYQGIQRKLNPEGYSSDIRLLFESSINQAKKTLPEGFDRKIIKENIEKNKELLFEWITIPDDEINFIKEEKKVQYEYPDAKNIIRTFFNSLFYSILANRKIYHSLIPLQIQRQVKKLEIGQIEIKQLLIDSTNKILSTFESCSGTNKELPFTSELEEIEVLLNDRKCRTAREKALIIEEKIKQINKREELEKLYQLIVNSFLMDTKNQEESIPYFEYLIAYTEDTAKKQYRKVLLNIIRRDLDAAQKILNTELEKIGDDKDRLYHLQMNIFLVNNQLSEAIDYLLSVKESFKDFPFWYTKINLLQANYNKAYLAFIEYEGYFQSEKYDLKRLKFDIEITYYNKLIQNGKNGFQEMKNFMSLLMKVDELISLSEEDDLTKCTLFCQKGYILMIIDKLEMAEKAYEEAEKIDSKNPLLLRNYPLLLTKDNDFMRNKKAVALLSLYRKENEHDLITENIYFHALIISNTKAAIGELRGLLVNEENLLVKVMFAKALDKDLKTKEASEFLERLIKQFPENIHVLHSMGTHSIRCGEKDNAITYFEDALKYQPYEPFKSMIMHDLILLYLSKRDNYFILKSRRLLENEYSKEYIIYNFSDIYLNILIILKDYRECLKICSELRKLDKETPEVIRKEAACFYNTQNYMMAADRFMKLNDLCALRNQELYCLAQCYLSLGNGDDAVDVIKQIKNPEVVDDYIAISQFYFIIGDTLRAIKTTHKAYKIYSSDRRIMEAFIYLVLFKNIQPNDDTIKKDFQECLRKYEASNFKNKILYSFKVTEEMSGEEIIEVMENATKEFGGLPSISPEKYIKDYQEKKLPLSFLKGIRNQNFFYIWDGAIKDPTMRIWSSWGNERDLSEMKITEAEEIYIDLTSLLTLDLLGLLTIIPELYKKVYITQSIVDEIHRLLSDESNILKPEGFITFDKDQQRKYIKYQENYFQGVFDRAKRIETYIKNNPEIFVIVGMPINSDRTIPEIFSKLDEIDFIKFDLDNVKYSIKDNIPVMIGNVLFREVFQNEKENPGCFGLVALLQRIAKKKKWTIKDYYNKIIILIDNNYYYFHINHYLLICSMKFEGYIITEKARKVFNLLSDPVYSLKDSIKVAGIFLTILWQEYITIEIKMKWSYFLLNILSKREEIDTKILLNLCYSIWELITNKQSFEGFREFILNYFNLIVGDD